MIATVATVRMRTNPQTLSIDGLDPRSCMACDLRITRVADFSNLAGLEGGQSMKLVSVQR